MSALVFYLNNIFCLVCAHFVFLLFVPLIDVAEESFGEAETELFKHPKPPSGIQRKMSSEYGFLYAISSNI